MKKFTLLILFLLYFSTNFSVFAVDQPSVPSAQQELSAGSGEQIDDESSAIRGLTVRQIISDGGKIMYPIVALSFVAAGLIFFYLLTLREKLLYPRDFILEAQDAAEVGDLESLKELCEANQSPAAKIISAALEQCSEGQALDNNALQEAMEDEGSRQAAYLWQRIQYLLDVSTVAPMIGLLGTVWGMMVSFSGLESGVNLINKADTLASGVAQAMYTTFGGLLVAIPCMLIYPLFRGRVNRLISNMENACNTVLRKLIKNRKESMFHH